MNNNTIYNIDFTRALPAALKEDATIHALGRVIADELQENIRLARRSIIYPRIDELDEKLLDILAYDLHIDWYDPDSAPEIKREIIKNSVKVHKRMGTKYAVESVVATYFGSGEVREWYEYGGEPHHFRIMSDNPSMTEEHAEQFFRILEVVKRKSAWLDNILIALSGESPLCLGTLLKEFTREAHIIVPQDYLDQYTQLYITGIVREHTSEAHIMGTQDQLHLYAAALLHEKSKEKNVIGSSERINALHSAMLYEHTKEKHIFEEE